MGCFVIDVAMHWYKSDYNQADILRLESKIGNGKSVWIKDNCYMKHTIVLTVKINVNCHLQFYTWKFKLKQPVECILIHFVGTSL